MKTKLLKNHDFQIEKSKFSLFKYFVPISIGNFPGHSESPETRSRGLESLVTVIENVLSHGQISGFSSKSVNYAFGPCRLTGAPTVVNGSNRYTPGSGRGASPYAAVISPLKIPDACAPPPSGRRPARAWGRHARTGVREFRWRSPRH